MRLSGLVPLLAELQEFRELLEAARGASGESAAPHVVVREAAKPYVIAGLQALSRRPLVVIASDGARAQEWHQDLLTWSGSPERVLLFPGFDALPFEQLPSVPEVIAARVGALIELAGDDSSPLPEGEGQGEGDLPTQYVIVTSIQALLFGLAPPEEFGHRVLSLRVGGTFNLNTLVHHL